MENLNQRSIRDNKFALLRMQQRKTEKNNLLASNNKPFEVVKENDKSLFKLDKFDKDKNDNLSICEDKCKNVSTRLGLYDRRIGGRR